MEKNGKRTVIPLFSGCVSSAVCKLHWPPAVPSLTSACTAEKFRHRRGVKANHVVVNLLDLPKFDQMGCTQPQGLTGIK